MSNLNIHDMINNNPKEHVKILLLGDPNVGKTSILHQYILGTFNDHSPITLGVETYHKKLIVDEKSIELDIFTAPGKVQLKMLLASKQHLMDCCMLVYDVKDIGSYDSLKKWRDLFIEQNFRPLLYEFPFIVVGNKRDEQELFEARIMKSSEEFWTPFNTCYTYMETSAKNNFGVEKTFTMAIRKGLGWQRMLMERNLQYHHLVNDN